MTRLSSKKHLRSLLVLAVAPLIAFGQSRQVEPTAGTWKTWIISSGRDFRVPPPPDAAAQRPSSHGCERQSHSRTLALWIRSAFGTPGHRRTDGWT